MASHHFTVLSDQDRIDEAVLPHIAFELSYLLTRMFAGVIRVRPNRVRLNPLDSYGVSMPDRRRSLGGIKRRSIDRIAASFHGFSTSGQS
jgi:hypothetical protein